MVEIKWLKVTIVVFFAIFPLTFFGIIGSFMQIPIIGDIIEPAIYIIAAAYVGYSLKEGYLNGAINGILIVIIATVIVSIIMSIITSITWTFIDQTFGLPIFDVEGTYGNSEDPGLSFIMGILGIVVWVMLFAINLISGAIGGVIGVLISKYKD